MMKKAINFICYLRLLVLHGFFSALSRIVKKDRDLWLISERTVDACDNAWVFFRYLRAAHPEIPCAYVIDRRSPEYQKVRAVGRVIQPGSFAHWLAFAASPVKISTHIMGYAPDRLRFTILDRRLRLVKGKKVMLQHGITGNMPDALRFPAARLDLFVCSTVPEYEMIRRTFGHPDGVPQLVGMCRFDDLLAPHETGRQILIMPTWRTWLKDADPDGFLQSEYYQRFQGLLENERFLSILEAYDLKAVFYLHAMLQRFSPLFRSENERVEIRTHADGNVPALLAESRLLITDYSSVHFDFAYMDKPVLYWQFDEDAFYTMHYPRGQFDCRRDGFGPVFDTADPGPLLDCLEAEAGDEMRNPSRYHEKARACFSEKRGDHCERTFRAIRALL